MEKLKQLEKQMETAQLAMKTALENQYPIGYEVGIFLNSKQRNPTWATVICHPGHSRADYLRVRLRGSDSIRGVRDVHFSQVVC